MRLRRALLLAAVLVLGADVAVVGTGTANARPDASGPVVDAAPAPTTTTARADPAYRWVPPLETEPLAPTTTILLPKPIDVPADPYADVPIVAIGSLQIPALGLEATLYEGIELTVIDNGPSHWPGSALPGQLGNVVVAGHRVTHSKPFRNLDQLVPGDQAIFTTDQGTFTYELVSIEIVNPDGMHIVNQSMAYTATMFACHPPGSAKQRIVAHWQLQDPPPVPNPG